MDGLRPDPLLHWPATGGALEEAAVCGERADLDLLFAGTTNRVTCPLCLAWLSRRSWLRHRLQMPAIVGGAK